MIVQAQPPLLVPLGKVKIKIIVIAVAIAAIPNISISILLDFLFPKSCISESIPIYNISSLIMIVVH
ncbi:MAG: hypothetical protein ACFFG0_50750 [Candidatus Thorarchaeota archaeon]